MIFGAVRAKLKLKQYNVDDYHPGKWKTSWLRKICSGNESRARKEKMMKWVFQTLSKNRD